jgi:uncharacterized damage-inducible protein DinB
MKGLQYVSVCCLLIAAAVAPGRAQEAKGFRADLMGQIQYAQKEILDLENAIPDKKMTWRPNKEVRSISEVYSHIAYANYLLAKFAGVALPEGINTSSQEDGTKWEKASTDKKVIREQLVKSFDFVKDAVGTISDARLENTVDFFGQKMTVRGVLLALLSHMHEHLGQSIAYARMVGVVPPWTAAEMAAAKAKK